MRIPSILPRVGTVFLLATMYFSNLNAQVTTASTENFVSDYFINLTYELSPDNVGDGCQSVVASVITGDCGGGSVIGDITNPVDGAETVVQFPIGPNLSITGTKLEAEFECQGVSQAFFYCRTITNGPLRTDPIYPPENVRASDAEFFDQVRVSWAKGTDIPDDQHSYNIYVNGVLALNVSGSTREWFDTGLATGVVREYSVSTVSSFGNTTAQESTKPSDFGRTPDLDASDGDYQGRTNLTFPAMSAFADAVKVVRSNPGFVPEFEELAVLDKSASSYNDYDGTPGFNYSYGIIPVLADGSLLDTIFDDGYSKANGIIRGYVRTLQGTGVSGVNVDVTYTASVPTDGPGWSCATETYCTTTDDAGYYEITEVFYGTIAEFTITPSLSDPNSHTFSPTATDRTLSLENRIAEDVDFFDLTAVTVGGNVSFVSDTCPVEDVTILINGEDENIRTDDKGDWSYALSSTGTYAFTPQLLDHSFEDGSGDSESTLTIDEDNTDIDFFNTTLRQAEILVQGGCQLSLGDTVKVDIRHADNCFTTRSIKIEEDGVILLTDLPPRDNYEVQVIDVVGASIPVANITSQFGVQDLDLLAPDIYEKIKVTRNEVIIPEVTATLPDGTTVVVTPEDTVIETSVDTVVEDFPTVRFVYRGAIDFDLSFESAGAELLTTCNSGDDFFDIPILQKAVKYDLTIEVFEDQGDDRCEIEQGTLFIYDEISDREDQAQSVPVVNGIASYSVLAGEADVSVSTNNPFQKYLYIVPGIDFSTVNPKTYWAVVEGIKENEPTFVTGTPDIPQLILHDPPGDNSYAFIEQGTSITTFIQTSVFTGESSGTFESLEVGSQFELGPSSASVGSVAEASVESGTNESNEEGFFSTITFSEDFSTSSLENFTGESGDVYIGAAYNQTYDLSERLEIDDQTCEAGIDTALTIGLFDFETTFIYAESFIKNTLLPNLRTLRGLSDTTNEAGRIQYNGYQADIQSWERILESNEANRETASDQFLLDKNLSVSAGTQFSKTYTVAEGVSTTYEVETFLNEESTEAINAEAKTIGLYVATQNGSMITTSYSYSETTGEESDDTRTIGYVIEDNDLGDFITFDVLRDPDYDTPIFRTISGTTSCPQEANTQPRDKPELGVSSNTDPGTNTVNNVPIGESAKFKLSVTNNSPSGELREYAVRVITTSNPDGALIRLSGSLINSSPAALFVAAGQTVDFDLTVERGPIVNNYSNIQIMVYPPCEFELFQDGGVLQNADTVTISANFESDCSQISITDPGNDWVVNQASSDMLPVTIGGFDPNNESFESVSIWLKRKGEGYQIVQQINKDDLLFPFSNTVIDVSGYPDGNYVIRASANCDAGTSVNFSGELEGIIARNSLAPFGTPTPSDGFLRLGQDIKVTFDRDINGSDLSDAVITLERDDTGTPIAYSTQISNNELIIVPDTNLFTRPELFGVQLNARVDSLKDLNGNTQEFSVDWSFLVNVKPVFWDPDTIDLLAIEGSELLFDVSLKNQSALAKLFTLDENVDAVAQVPEWLRVTTQAGSVLSDGETVIDFVFDGESDPGMYSGDVIAAVDGLPVVLHVRLENLAKAPNWAFDPADYEYSMNIVMQFSLDQTDTNLSTDTRDLIAAFVDGEVRGIANIDYLPGSDHYRAFMTVYSNTAGGGGAEDISFRFWHALTGIEYGAVETTTFGENDQLNSINDPFILHPVGSFQVIPLKVGWNWISLNVVNEDMSREAVFQSILRLNGPNVITVKSQSEIAEYSSGTGWGGSLKDLNNSEGYLVHLSDEPDTLFIVGTVVPTPADVDVDEGWNWIGYPRQTAEPIDSTLQDLAPQSGDLLKSQTRFAEFAGVQDGWEGSLAQFEPGSGYKLRLGDPGTITYRTTGYQVIPSAWEYNMNVTAFIDFTGLPSMNVDNLLVGGFIDGQCRGVARVEYIEKTGSHRVFMLIYGNKVDREKPIEIRLLDQSSLREYIHIHEVFYGSDNLMGSIVDPYPIVFGSEATVQGTKAVNVVPNPTSTNAIAMFSFTDETELTVQLYDVGGTLLRQIATGRSVTGSHNERIDLSGLASGMYYIRWQTATDQGTERVIKQ